jgi:hypothetical protein
MHRKLKPRKKRKKPTRSNSSQLVKGRAYALPFFICEPVMHLNRLLRLLVLAVLLAGSPISAAPYRPTDAAAVLERLPFNKGDERTRALAADRARLAAAPYWR